jgi:hypothetical protein
VDFVASRGERLSRGFTVYARNFGINVARAASNIGGRGSLALDSQSRADVFFLGGT